MASSKKTGGKSASKDEASALDAFVGGGFAPALEDGSLANLRSEYGHFIGGKWVEPKECLVTINPATERKLATVGEGSEAEVEAAVKAARAAFEGPWGKMAAAERGKYLFRLARLMAERGRELAVVETLDGGKPIRESRDIDIPLASAHFFYHAGWADKLEYVFRGGNPKPLGVIGQVIPWNFPLLMAAWKLAPALACGNTVVLKPAETTPLTALKLAELVEHAGFPPGVVNVVTGAGATGRALVNHPGIDKVAFTGSTAVGKSIMRALAGRETKYTLELGGKAANLVFADAAIDQAVEGIVQGIFFNQGQVCCAGSRLLVEECVEEEVVSKLKRRMEGLVVGDPMDKNTDVGAINSAAQRERIEELVAVGEAEGGVRWQAAGELPKKGFFFAPTLFSGCSQAQRIVQEEIFGPVLTIQTFRTEAEAISLANNTRYGLSAGVWSDKGSKVFATTTAMKAGVVWGNTFNRFDPTSPFGGYKESGVGREGGVHGLGAYLDLEGMEGGVLRDLTGTFYANSSV